MSQKKKLLKSINELEKKVKLAKRNTLKHRHYFARLIGRNDYLLIALLVPAFLGGWQSGKLARGGKQLQLFGKYSFLTLFKLIRNYNKLI